MVVADACSDEASDAVLMLGLERDNVEAERIPSTADDDSPRNFVFRAPGFTEVVHIVEASFFHDESSQQGCPETRDEKVDSCCDRSEDKIDGGHVGGALAKTEFEGSSYLCDMHIGHWFLSLLVRNGRCRSSRGGVMCNPGGQRPNDDCG